MNILMKPKLFDFKGDVLITRGGKKAKLNILQYVCSAKLGFLELEEARYKGSEERKISSAPRIWSPE